MHPVEWECDHNPCAWAMPRCCRWHSFRPAHILNVLTTPLSGCEDRVACHACGKVLFNWDPDDEILDAHRLFSPDCALVTGKPLEPLPEEGDAGEESKPAWAAAATIAPGAAGESITANLSSFVETLRQTASSVDVEDLVKRAKV
jgi:hypothetical protein